MKKFWIVLLVISALTIGCESSNSDDKISVLNTEIESLNNQLSILSQEKDDEISALASENETLNSKVNEMVSRLETKDTEIGALEHHLAVGRGFAVQYMFDMNTLYDALNGPIYKVDSDAELEMAMELVYRLNKDPNFLRRKIVTLELFDRSSAEKEMYLVNGLSFSPEDIETLTTYIEEGSGIPYEAIEMYSITIVKNADSFEYEINQ